MQRRPKQTMSFQDRLAAFADMLRGKAKDIPPGPERDKLERKLEQAEDAAHINDWANSRELRPPK